MGGFGAFLRDNALFLSAGVLLSFTSSFGQTFFISVFAAGIMRDFGLTDGQWGLLYTVATSCSALAMLWAGVLTDRFRVRHLHVVVTLLLAGAALAMATVTSVAALAVTVFALRFAGQGMMFHVGVVAMARWFVATRGRALSVASMGVATGQALLPVAFVALLGVADWRVLWVVVAGVVLAGLPAMQRLLRAERTPRSLAEAPQAAGMRGRHWTRRDLLGHWLFWAMVPMLLAPPAFGTALFFHQVHLTQVKDWALVDYVALLPLFTAVSIAAMFLSGAVLDRVGSARLMQGLMLPYVAAFAVLAGAQTLWGAAGALMLFAAGAGAQATVPAAFFAEFFGTRHLGAIKALSAAVMVFGTAIGPGLTGALIDAGFDLPEQMPGIAAWFLGSGVLAAWAIARARRDLAAAPQVDVAGA
ncbi:MFS transporter [Jannaschia rubra]|uniref:Oxalate/formate antiporter family transporter n=1 Tax=Jannaschia rubra TaxID=282197 RepID=A0A0M6XNN9_9RHOB|nr:MFS transporter [Jannaschia rubra]CTQ32790.1 oxalate/formate antiporter family transporter [Jannaschia rubra]SFF89528.1 Predicted arabinose efflux permease, MFS family [Jannaschia rubra]